MNAEEALQTLHDTTLIVNNVKNVDCELAPRGAFEVSILMLQRIIDSVENNGYEANDEFDDDFYHYEGFIDHYQKEIEGLFK